jgi:hypothetical protein
MNNIKIINEIISFIGKSHGLDSPPEGYCEKYKATGAENCRGCPYDKFCLAATTSKLNLAVAVSRKNTNYNLFKDVSTNMLIASSGMTPAPNYDEFIEDEFFDDESLLEEY